MCECARARVCVYMHACVRVYACVCARTCRCACACACACAHNAARFRYRIKEQAKVNEPERSKATHEVSRDDHRPTRQPHDASIEMEELQVSPVCTVPPTRFFRTPLRAHQMCRPYPPLSSQMTIHPSSPGSAFLCYVHACMCCVCFGRRAN